MFLWRFARQGHEQNAVKTFCAVPDAAPARILGFYSVAPASVEHDAVPAAMTKGLARHDVPGFPLARLAVDKSVAGRGLGGQLLLAAALRCIRVTENVGGVLMIIDAKNERCRIAGVFEIAIHLISMGYPCRNYEIDSG
ncbi:MAG: pathogenicity island protein [Rhizobiales bacterium]|nr:pathogenicity island protein [Hyphomicrobiales bacterium]